MTYEWSLIMNSHLNYVAFKLTVNKDSEAVHLDKQVFTIDITEVIEITAAGLMS